MLLDYAATVRPAALLFYLLQSILTATQQKNRPQKLRHGVQSWDTSMTQGIGAHGQKMSTIPYEEQAILNPVERKKAKLATQSKNAGRLKKLLIQYLLYVLSVNSVSSTMITVLNVRLHQLIQQVKSTLPLSTVVTRIHSCRISHAVGQTSAVHLP